MRVASRTARIHTVAGGSLPPEVSDLIARHLDSVVRLEVLLHLYARPDVPHSAADVAKELRIEPAWADGQLNELHTRGFTSKDSAETPRFRYAPTDPAFASAVAALAQAFADR